MASAEPRELYIVRVERGGPWDWSKDMREQEQWTEHAHFMNALVDAGSEEELRARFADDPWAQNGMLTVKSVEPWTILLAPEE